MKPQPLARSILRSVAVLVAPLVATACAVLSGLTGFERGACEVEPCVAEAGDARDVDANDARDGESDGGDGETIPAPEELVCGDLACTPGRSCCAPADGGPVRCAALCDGVLIGCMRDTQCFAGEVCCGLATTGRDGEAVDSILCTKALECRGHTLCENASSCPEDGGCAAPTGSPGSPKLCVLR